MRTRRRPAIGKFHCLDSRFRRTNDVLRSLKAIFERKKSFHASCRLQPMRTQTISTHVLHVQAQI